MTRKFVCSPKFSFDQKKLLVPRNICSIKMFGRTFLQFKKNVGLKKISPKICWVQKCHPKIFGQKEFLVRNFFWFKNDSGSKNLSQKKFRSTKVWVQLKKCLARKSFGPQKFGSENSFGLAKFWSNKILVPKNFDP